MEQANNENVTIKRKGQGHRKECSNCGYAGVYSRIDKMFIVKPHLAKNCPFLPK